MSNQYFHYTSIGALFEIVSTGKIWLSSLAFMNDEKEGLELLASLLKATGENLSAGEKDLFETIVGTSTRWQFVFCASRLEDDISQWRAYTELGFGACIEFGDNFIIEERVDRVECIYDPDKKENMIEKYGLNVTGDELDKATASPSLQEGYLGKFIAALSKVKHQSFKPEDEVRWVASLGGLSDTRFTIKYRPHRLGLVPYLEVPVDLNDISAVWLGPKVPHHNKLSVEDFLMLNKCTGLVKQSDVTLR